MAEENPQLVSISFGTKISTGNYENEDLRISITESFPSSFSEDDLLTEAESLANKVKAEVYKHAGVEADLSDDGLIMRRLKAGVSESGSNKSSTAAPSASRKTPRKANTGAPAGEKPSAALWRALMELSDDDRAGEFYDNRPKIISGESSPKAPPFRNKKKKDLAMWVSDIPEDLSDLRTAFEKSCGESYAFIQAFD